MNKSLLLEHLEKSNLLTPEQIQAVHDFAHAKGGTAEGAHGEVNAANVNASEIETANVNGSEVMGCAHFCVEQNWLTYWQAQQILFGRHQFFLGNYVLLDKLGEGGMGAVFKAKHVKLGRFVALKVISDKMLDNPNSVKRFQREARAIASLNHPNIVSAFDADCVGKTHLLVMEFIDGCDLHAWLKTYGRLPIAWSCECIKQAAIGLQHAFEKGLVHRDIKPSNLFVRQEEHTRLPIVKILDLGIARFTHEEQGSTQLTGTGFMIGTAEYMSPEQGNNPREVDVRSDIYSLGIALYELLTGKTPFPAETPVQTLLIRSTQPAPSVRKLRKDIPRKLDQIVAKMLKTEPHQRFQTPNDVVAALEAFSLTARDISKREVLKLPQPNLKPFRLREGDAEVFDLPKEVANQAFETTLSEGAPLLPASKPAKALQKAPDRATWNSNHQSVINHKKPIRLAVLYETSFLLKRMFLLPYAHAWNEVQTIHVITDEVKQELRELQHSPGGAQLVQRGKKLLVGIMDQDSPSDYLEVRLEGYTTPISWDQDLGAHTKAGQLLVGYGKQALEEGYYTHVVIASDDGGVALDLKKLRQEIGLPIFVWTSTEELHTNAAIHDIQLQQTARQRANARRWQSFRFTLWLGVFVALCLVGYWSFKINPYITFAVGGLLALLFGPALIEVWLQKNEK